VRCQSPIFFAEASVTGIREYRFWKIRSWSRRLPYVREVEVDDDDGAAVASVRIIEEECVERGRRDRHVFEGVMLAWPVMDGCRTAGAQLSVLALQKLRQADSMDGCGLAFAQDYEMDSKPNPHRRSCPSLHVVIREC